MSRALAGASAFAFAVALGEFGATTFVARPDTPTLPVVIGRLISRPGAVNAGMALAAAVILAVLCAVSVFLVDAADRGPARRTRHRRLLMLELAGRLSVSRIRSVPAVSDVTLTVPDGTVLALLGPSGCGKSTLLRAVAGLEPVAAGEIRWDGIDLARVPIHRRGFGLMFQDGVLFPHRDVAGNIAYGLHRAGLRGAAVDHPGRRTAGTGRPARLRTAAGRPRSPAARRSESRWPVRWRRNRGCCCWTNRSPRWTGRCVSAC